MLTMAQVTLQVKRKMTFSHDVGHEIDQILNMRAAAQLINAVFWAAPHIYILSTTCGEASSERGGMKGGFACNTGFLSACFSLHRLVLKADRHLLPHPLDNVERGRTVHLACQ